MRTCSFIFLLAVVAGGVAHAQTVDSFEFGRNAAAAVKIATQLDYVNEKCKREATPIYINQTNFILKEIGGRSASSVRENAAKVMGVTADKVRQMVLNEADEVVSQSGGCNSNTLRASMQDALRRWGEYQTYLTQVADLMRRNPGRNIFR